jgi:hypothetical protein
MNRKGMSEVVTTVLIILLVLGAIVIIWAVVKPMLERSSQQINTDSITSSLSIAPNSLKITPDNNITLKVLRNVGEGNITGVNVILETSSGQRKTFKIPGEIKELETKTISIPKSTHGITEEITKVLVSAIVTNSNGEEVYSSMTSSANAPAPVSIPLPSGLVIYFPMNESSGTTAKDYSGNNFDGIITAGVTLNAPGKKGTAFNFNGASTNYVNARNQSIFIFSNFTVQAWMKWNCISTSCFQNNTLVIKNNGNWDSGAFAMEVAQSYWFMGAKVAPYPIPRCDFWGNSGDVFKYVDLRDGNWHQIVCTYDATSKNYSMYIDGAWANSTINTGSGPNVQVQPAFTLHIGESFNGTLDEVAIWNRALNSSEVQQLYSR